MPRPQDRSISSAISPGCGKGRVNPSASKKEHEWLDAGVARINCAELCKGRRNTAQTLHNHERDSWAGSSIHRPAGGAGSAQHGCVRILSCGMMRPAHTPAGYRSTEVAFQLAAALRDSREPHCFQVITTKRFYKGKCQKKKSRNGSGLPSTKLPEFKGKHPKLRQLSTWLLTKSWRWKSLSL